MAPPPNISRKPVQNFIDGEEAKPALPPRQGSSGMGSGGGGSGRSLIDDEPEDMGRLGEWEVLRPGR
jgi:inositol-1,4,5-trisphosphate 5-phosphatase